MQKITPFLWFNDNAEEAVAFYVSVFKDAKTGKVARYPDDSPGPTGQVMTVPFQLFGQDFIALNGGPIFSFSPAISFVVSCETQEEIDYYWEKLLDGGKASQCGWLDDKYGVTWQIVPTIMGELFQQSDAERGKRVMEAMLKMVKLDIATLKRAFDGTP